jgi:hypothetical protein
MTSRRARSAHSPVAAEEPPREGPAAARRQYLVRWADREAFVASGLDPAREPLAPRVGMAPRSVLVVNVADGFAILDEYACDGVEWDWVGGAGL